MSPRAHCWELRGTEDVICSKIDFKDPFIGSLRGMDYVVHIAYSLYLPLENGMECNGKYICVFRTLGVPEALHNETAIKFKNRKAIVLECCTVRWLIEKS